MTAATAVPYVLGVSDDEVRRLVTQSNAYQEVTEDGLRRAGLAEGMHVLDVGTGAGGVALIASQIVGSTGTVTAIDASPKMLAVAQAQAALHQAENITFLEADLGTWEAQGEVDVVTGRLILMHLDDPTAALRGLARAIRPGGLAIFADFVMSGALQSPAAPLFTETIDRVLTTFRQAGRPTDMGLQLARTFRAAGLPSPRCQVGGVVAEGSDPIVYEMLAGITRTLLPAMRQFGIADETSLDIATLEERLRAEAAAYEAVAVPPLLVTAWSQKPLP